MKGLGLRSSGLLGFCGFGEAQGSRKAPCRLSEGLSRNEQAVGSKPVGKLMLLDDMQQDTKMGAGGVLGFGASEGRHTITDMKLSAHPRTFRQPSGQSHLSITPTFV